MSTNHFAICSHLLFFSSVVRRSTIRSATRWSLPPYAGLYPSDDLAAAKCDAIMDCATDYYINIRPSFMEKDEAKKVRHK